MNTARQGQPGRRPAWDALHRGLRVTVFGAERPLGREVTALLLAAGHPAAGIQLQGSAPARLNWRGRALQVEVTQGVPAGTHLAFLAEEPSRAARSLDLLLETDCRVVDLSGVGRSRGAAVLLREPTGEAPGLFARLLVLPRPELQALLLALGPLARESGLRSLALTSFQPRPDPRGGSAEAPAGWTRDPPAVGSQGTPQELGGWLGSGDLPIDLDPWPGLHPRCALHLVRCELERALDPRRAREMWARGAPWLRLGGAEAPDLKALAGTAQVQVGRIRAGSDAAPSLCFCAASDPLRLAATAAVEVAARLPAVS